MYEPPHHNTETGKKSIEELESYKSIKRSAEKLAKKLEKINKSMNEK